MPRHGAKSTWSEAAHSGVAVTQQLARLTWDHVQLCRSSVPALHEVCSSFEAVPDTDHLDLDWAPRMLLDTAEALGAASALAASLRRACAGDDEVNPGYRDAPDTIWEHPVNSIDPTSVASVARDLGDLDALFQEAIGSPAGVPVTPSLRELVPGSETAYIREHWVDLLAFYTAAADRGLAVVVWWD